MNRRLLSVFFVSSLFVAPALLSAQLSTGISLAAGLSVPTGDFADAFSSGYNGAVALNVGAPLLPVGFRLEGAYNGFSGKSGVNADARIVSGTANATFGLGLPYLIGGVGYYNEHSKSNGTVSVSSTESAVGFNVGAGLRFPLGVMSTFVEARYHKVGGDVDTAYIPITFGIQF